MGTITWSTITAVCKTCCEAVFNCLVPDYNFLNFHYNHNFVTQTRNLLKLNQRSKELQKKCFRPNKFMRCDKIQVLLNSWLHTLGKLDMSNIGFLWGENVRFVPSPQSNGWFTLPSMSISELGPKSYSFVLLPQWAFLTFDISHFYNSAVDAREERELGEIEEECEWEDTDFEEEVVDEEEKEEMGWSALTTL